MCEKCVRTYVRMYVRKVRTYVVARLVHSSLLLMNVNLQEKLPKIRLFASRLDDDIRTCMKPTGSETPSREMPVMLIREPVQLNLV
jgi:hypothetical protein